MKIRAMIASMMVLGSLTLVGCSSTSDYGIPDNINTGGQQEEQTTKPEPKPEEIISEDYNEGWNFALDLDDEGLLPITEKDLRDRAYSRYQEGATDKVQDFYQGFIACLVELGYVESGAEEVTFKYSFATYRMNPVNNDYDVQMKQAAALDAALAKAAMDYDAESFYAQIKGYDINNKENLIIEVVDQDNNFIERYVYYTNLGEVKVMEVQ